MLPDARSPVSHSPRTAAEAFLRGATQGWGRRELAQWLVCHYGVVARASCEPARSEPGSGQRGSLEEAAIERLVRNARHEVLRLLYDLADADMAGGLARLAIARGLVGSDSPHGEGGRAWVPLDGPRLGLVDRVASLFYADWLNAPLDYRGLLVCRGCGGIGFAGAHTHAPGCQPKRYDSGVASCEVESAPPTLRCPTLRSESA